MHTAIHRSGHGTLTYIAMVNTSDLYGIYIQRTSCSRKSARKGVAGLWYIHFVEGCGYARNELHVQANDEKSIIVSTTN